jgi:hypothetical protein
MKQDQFKMPVKVEHHNYDLLFSDIVKNKLNQKKENIMKLNE